MRSGSDPGCRRDQLDRVRGEHHGEVALRAGGVHRHGGIGPRGTTDQAGDHPDPVDEDRRGIVRQDGIGIDHHLDVPGVEHVLAESEADKAVEVERHRTHGHGEVAALILTDGIEGGHQSGVGHQGLGRLVLGRFGVPLVPHGLVERSVGLACGQGVLEAAAHDDGAGADMREHISHRPLGRVRGLADRSGLEPVHDPAQPGRRGVQGGEFFTHGGPFGSKVENPTLGVR